MKISSWLVICVICALHIRGFQGAVTPSYDGRGAGKGLDNTSESEKAQDAVEDLVKLLTWSESKTGGNEREGRALFSPGKWCALPLAIRNALGDNSRSARTIGTFQCSPPAWKQAFTKFTKGTTTPASTPCGVTSDTNGPCISDAPVGP